MKFMPYIVSTVLALAATGCSAASQPSTGNHAGSPAGKPGAAVDVQLTGGGRLASGAQAPLALQFRTGSANATLNVEYRTEGGLALQGAAAVQLTANQDGIASDAPVVRALADGVHYLNVFVTVNGRSQAVSIPVAVGNAQPALKPAGKAVTTPQGENLIILPADGKQ